MSWWMCLHGNKIRSTDITKIMGKYFVSMWYCQDYSRRTQIFSLKSVWIASGIQDVWVESLKNFQLKCFRVDLKSCKRRQIRWVNTEVNSNWPDQNNKSLWSLRWHFQQLLGVFRLYNSWEGYWRMKNSCPSTKRSLVEQSK